MIKAKFGKYISVAVDVKFSKSASAGNILYTFYVRQYS